MKKVTLDKIIAFLKIYLTFSCCWPLPYNATKSQIVRDRLLRLFCSLHAILLIVEILYAIFYCTDNIRTKMMLSFGANIFISVLLQIILFTLYQDSLQAMIYQMENYYKRAKLVEKKVFQELIDKYIIALVIITIAAVSTIVEPLLHGSGQFPFPITYPFPQFHEQPLKTIVYLHLSFGVYQGYLQTICNFLFSLLLWFSSVRFEVLSKKFRMVEKYSNWQLCVQEHQELLRLTKKITSLTSYFVLLSISSSTFLLVFCGIIILNPEPLTSKIDCCTIFISSMLKVLLFAWPADYLLTASSNVANAAYDALWYDHRVNSQRIMLFTIVRCQQPVIITVPGLLKALTFEYYMHYVSTAFSYLTTLRLIFSKNDAETYENNY